MGGSAVKWLRSEKVAHLEFCRSAKRNALRLRDWVALSAALDAIRKAEVQSLVIGSAVPDIFCAGFDLGEVEALAAQPEDAAPFAAIVAQVMRQLSKGPIVTIAAISGACHGAGVAIAMACDIRIASPSATFSIPPAKFGFSYPTGDIRRLAELVASARLRASFIAPRPLMQRRQSALA
jgi:enoyl-CoA hydratase/carnithine racemase